MTDTIARVADQISHAFERQEQKGDLRSIVANVLNGYVVSEKPPERRSPLIPPTPRRMDLPDQVPVQYIGKKSEYTDRLYKTGLVFGPKQVRVVPKSVAEKFLIHLDLFALADEAPAEEVKTDTAAQLEKAADKKDEKQDDINRMQDLHDQVNHQMDTEALASFAFSQWQHKLDRRLSLANQREKVIRLIDQYGAV